MSEPISPNGRAVLTLKGPLGLALAIVTLVSSNTLPALAAAQIVVPVWVPIILGNITGILMIIGQYSGGLRTEKPKKPKTGIPGTVPAPVPPEKP